MPVSHAPRAFRTLNSRARALHCSAYLAEDRLLGFEIVAKTGKNWTLHYNHTAQAYTDVPTTVGVLVRQRRRWMNGSLFAQIMGACARA